MARYQCSGIESDRYPKDDGQKEPQHLQLWQNKGIRDLEPVYRPSQKSAKKRACSNTWYILHRLWVIFLKEKDSRSISSIGNPRSPFWYLCYPLSAFGQLHALTLHWSIKCNRKYRYKDLLGTRRPWKKLGRCMERRSIYKGDNIYSLRANNRGRAICLSYIYGVEIHTHGCSHWYPGYDEFGHFSVPITRPALFP